MSSTPLVTLTPSTGVNCNVAQSGVVTCSFVAAPEVTVATVDCPPARGVLILDEKAINSDDSRPVSREKPLSGPSAYYYPDVDDGILIASLDDKISS